MRLRSRGLTHFEKEEMAKPKTENTGSRRWSTGKKNGLTRLSSVSVAPAQVTNGKTVALREALVTEVSNCVREFSGKGFEIFGPSAP